MGDTTRRGFLAVAGAALLLPSCESGGNFTLLGYTSRPNYDCNIHTVRVPIFKNKTFIKGVEFDLTEAVVHEIELKTPYKVANAGQTADTELTGTVVSYTKGLLNVSELNEVREAEITLGVEVVWRDLRTGEILSKPPRRPGEPMQERAVQPINLGLGPTVPVVAPRMPTGPTAAPPDPANAPPVDPTAPTGGIGTAPPAGTPPTPPQPTAVLVKGDSSFIPELGQSLTSALAKDVSNIARQIVQLMEKPW
jgi:hypothetical protein